MQPVHPHFSSTHGRLDRKRPAARALLAGPGRDACQDDTIYSLQPPLLNTTHLLEDMLNGKHVIQRHAALQVPVHSCSTVHSCLPQGKPRQVNWTVLSNFPPCLRKGDHCRPRYPRRSAHTHNELKMCEPQAAAPAKVVCDQAPKLNRPSNAFLETFESGYTSCT